MEMNWYCLKLTKWTMKSWQNHFDVITILIIWRQNYTIYWKEKGKLALEAEIVTDGKTEKNYSEYTCTQQENTEWDVSCFVVKDNKCILSCTVSPIGANSPLNKSSEELRMKQWCWYFHSSFQLFKIMQSKQRWHWSSYHLSLEDQNRMLGLTGMILFIAWLGALFKERYKIIHTAFS